MSVRNITRGTELAKKLLTPSTLFSGALYGLSTQGIPSGCALWISPCDAIYTVGLTSPVDVIFVDSEMRVVKTLSSLPPNCYTDSGKDAIGALELPPNKLYESGTDTGDVLSLDDE
jgi:hypothetical protein